MGSVQDIYEAITTEGFGRSTLLLINEYINSVENGTADFSRFNQQEHAGLCKAGSALIGASIVACYASRSVAAGVNAESSQRSSGSWEIDERQEQLIELWAKSAGLWVGDTVFEASIDFGPMIAQGVEAKVYYREGATAVLKERASIYSTTQKALDAIVLHNFLFPETAMHVIGFMRDDDGIFRIILTQPYVRCLRLATKDEIDRMVESKGFRDNRDGQGVNYISDRIVLEDLHPANVFVDVITERPICIDCIVKFVK